MYVDKLIELMNKSIEIDCVPVGAIVVQNGKIIGCGYNKKNRSNIISDHAEIIALNEACKYLNDWRLDGCELYVTLFPCLMCLGAIKESRIKKVYYVMDRIKNEMCVNVNVLTDVEFIKINDKGLSEKRITNFFKNMRKSNL